MIEQRQHSRERFESDVQVTHDSLGTVILKMRDFSNGGIFLYKKEGVSLPPVGTMVEIQALAFGEAAPVLQAKIVRETNNGIGLMFCVENQPVSSDHDEPVSDALSE